MRTIRDILIGQDRYIEFFFEMLVLSGLYLVSLYSYLFFHTLVELFSISVAFGIFVIAWNSRQFINNTYLLFIGIAYLFAGAFDFLHTLSYQGMSIFKEYTANLPTQLWVASRSIQSISLLIAPLFIRRKFNYNIVLVIYILLSGFLLASIFYWKVFPVCYIEGTGLTSFKKTCEYIISLILLASVVLLLRKRRYFDADVLQLLALSIILNIGAELAFTFYVGAYDLSNLIGHYFKLISFYLIYKAIIVTSLIRPHDILFRALKQSEAGLTELNQELETTIAERTMSLMALTVADRVRNPAMVIGGICRRFLEKEKFPDKLIRDLEKIVGETERLESIVKDFESLLKLRQSRFVYEDISEIVKMVLPILEKEAAEKSIGFLVNIPEQPLKINAQKNLLRGAIFHVMRNAIDATPRGGRITVTTSQDADKIILTISDTGSGIPKEVMERVFDPFFSTKPFRFGMGLSMVKQIVTEHLGEIKLESEVGRGTTFQMVFPARWIIPLKFKSRHESQ